MVRVAAPLRGVADGVPINHSHPAAFFVRILNDAQGFQFIRPPLSVGVVRVQGKDKSFVQRRLLSRQILHGSGAVQADAPFAIGVLKIRVYSRFCHDSTPFINGYERGSRRSG
jgi:hypothetical protein